MCMGQQLCSTITTESVSDTIYRFAVSVIVDPRCVNSWPALQFKMPETKSAQLMSVITGEKREESFWNDYRESRTNHTRH